jgi:uncharacterized integral membrane protein
MAAPTIIRRLVERFEKYRDTFFINNKRRVVNLRRWELGGLIVLSILLSLLYYFPILNSDNNIGIQDWDQNFAWTEASRVSLLNYHQFPLWDPYTCGGSVQFANPQIPVISFQTMFALLFGTVRGIKISIFFHGVIGFIGFYFLARQYKLSYVGSLLASIIFSFSGITGSFLSTGMVVFTSFAYTPYILICFNKSIDQGKWGIIAGTLFALSFYYAYQIPLLLGVYIFIYTLVIYIAKRSLIPFKAFTIMLLTSTLFILPKLLFSYQLLRIYPRPLNDVSGYSIHNLLYFLLSQKQNLFNEMNVQGYFYGIDENSIYIGIITFIIFFLFFVKNTKEVKNNISLVITLVIILWIMLGSVINPSLFMAIKHLPVFSSFRVAQRFRFDLIVPFSLITGLGVDNVIRLLQTNKLAKLISIICLVVIYVDLTIFSTNNFLSKTLIIINPESHFSRGTDFVQTTANNPDFEIQRTIQIPDKFLDKNTFIPWSFEYLKIKQNKGVLECYDPIPIGVNALGISEEKYQGEFHLLEPDDRIKVENTFWSPNKLIFNITNASKVMNNSLIINQNFYPGWIVMKDNDHCERATSNNGLLATKLNSSIERVTLEFNPIEYYSLCK